jgi:hypothetical protein
MNNATTLQLDENGNNILMHVHPSTIIDITTKEDMSTSNNVKASLISVIDNNTNDDEDEI